MHRLVNPLTTLALLAGLVCGVAHGQAQDDLLVRDASARFDVHGRTGSARHTLKVRGAFPDLDTALAFDPTIHGLSVSVAGVEVLASEPSGDPQGFRFRRRRGELRKWRLRVKGPSGSVGRRTFSVNVRTGAFKLDVRRAGLPQVREAGPKDVTTIVTIGDVTAAKTFSFLTRGSSGRRWTYSSVPGGGPGGGGGPVGPLPYTALVSFSLSNTPLTHVIVARTQAELTTIWAMHSVPGPLPQVDFTQDMVVLISALVQGPGQFPPILNVNSVTGRSSHIEVGWSLSLCEENVCPGAPIPCPTASPFQIVRMQATTLEIRTVQGPTLGVCP